MSGMRSYEYDQKTLDEFWSLVGGSYKLQAVGFCSGDSNPERLQREIEKSKVLSEITTVVSSVEHAMQYLSCDRFKVTGVYPCCVKLEHEAALTVRYEYCGQRYNVIVPGVKAVRQTEANSYNIEDHVKYPYFGRRNAS